MDIAVLSDIHGNYIALQKCIAYALDKNITTFIFLGDYLGELAYPQKTMEMLYTLQKKYSCYFIKGNREEYFLNYKKNGETGWRDMDSTTGSLLYVYNNLKEKDFAFFQGLEHRQELVFEGLPSFTICHGSPNKTKEKMTPGDERTYAIMQEHKNAIILCGHTHKQTRIVHENKMVLNPGSVGIPLHSEGKTQFMILHGSDRFWQYEFLSLEYDVEKVISDLYEDGLDERAPYWCKTTEHLLRTGEVSHGVVLEKAMQLCREENGVCKWPDVPEKYWAQAVEELGVV